MAHITSSVEYGIHCLLWLANPENGQPSSRELADFQGISASFVAKIFTRMEKAGLVLATEGARGGYRLAREAGAISVLEIVDAIEGDKALFDCQEIRDRCAVFDDPAPRWATQGVCAIHAVMLRAEQAMRDALARESLADLAAAVERKAPKKFSNEVRDWLHERASARAAKRSERPRGK